MTSSITNFNEFCNQAENRLGSAARFPIVGVVPATIKFALGIAQAITALVLGILSAPFRCCSDDAAAFNDHCWTHVVHGLGNMVGGLGEALLSVTIVGGFILGYCRYNGIYFTNPDHQDKYIPYSDLIVRDVAALPLDYIALRRATCTGSPTAFRNAIGINVVPVRA